MKQIEKIVSLQRKFFETGTTLDYEYRLMQLKKLKSAVRKYTKELTKALKEDLNKADFEGYATEIGLVLEEISYAIRHLKRFMRPKVVPTSIVNFPSVSRIYKDPYGVVLVMSPWNYPILLTLDPLIGAIEGGNCCVVKPSAYSPATSAVMKRMLEEIYPEHYVTVIEGGREENQELLKQHFDFIFFTGSVSVGKTVQEAASHHLTPVCLELGGKSPCIVDETANLKLAAKRIAWGKFLNAGQTCVAPDYVLVQESVKDKLVEYLCLYIKRMYGSKLTESFPKIINEKHFRRVLSLMEGETKAIGGDYDSETLQIAPTVLDQATWSSASMQEEIFGPVLPILTYKNFKDMVQEGKQKPKPLAAYLFTTNSNHEKYFLKHYQSGGACINDTVMHLASTAMPFGGVGNSGMGGYHGKYSFDTFTHERSVLKKSVLVDVPLRYAPYKKWAYPVLKMLLR